ncbi:xanthine dehydrogenase family protein molybdopterin-binding subunit [Luteibacter sp. NPDC031894]|uniref:xanthine dehydrogenase family protein molybdopterin-binding subunit n=1 Tax=Luteibacter sp. NPDC031894 TaxID=3390572 RepID=UPI003D076D70
MNLSTNGQVRIDGLAKVTGAARYPSDEPVENAAYAYLVTSRIARGKVTRVDTTQALAVDGVRDVLTHENVGSEATPPPPQGAGGSTTTMESDRVWHDGQIVAMVVADTYGAAREAARKVIVVYDVEAPSASFDSPGAGYMPRQPSEHKDADVGDIDSGFSRATATIDAWYETPTQHHNPIELFTTTCAWDGDTLTIWEPSQFVYGLRASVAKQLGIDQAQVRVLSRFIGGAFGSKGGATARTAWVAIAAHRLGRAVKLVPTRGQGFTIVTYRAPTRHHMRLAADADGRLVSLCHEGWELTSRPSDYNVSGTETTARMYACPNIRTRVNVVHTDRNTPGFMRAPPETPYMFALECAMDELAEKLGLDPIELRRRNEPTADPVSGLPWSGRQLMACFEQGAQHFRWNARDPRPGSMGDAEWEHGFGCAAAAYPANIAPAAARVTRQSDGSVRVQIAGHDIGTGAYTVVAMIAGEALGIDPSRVSVEMGDTDLPPAGLAAGSSHTATISHAVRKACDQLIRSGSMEAYAEHTPASLPDDAMKKLHSGQMSIERGHGRKDVTSYSFGAQFVEVRVHRRTREIRIERMLGVFACGRIVNPLTAYSQFMGGLVWGIGAGLLEKTDVDERVARYTNDNLSEYHIPVNADVGRVEVIMLPEDDQATNALGIKGIGEIGIVGVNAAIANAVYHATGRRIRRLPVRMEDLLSEDRGAS